MPQRGCGARSRVGQGAAPWLPGRSASARPSLSSQQVPRSAPGLRRERFMGNGREVRAWLQFARASGRRRSVTCAAGADSGRVSRQHVRARMGVCRVVLPTLIHRPSGKRGAGRVHCGARHDVWCEGRVGRISRAGSRAAVLSSGNAPFSRGNPEIRAAPPRPPAAKKGRPRRRSFLTPLPQASR